MHPHIRTAVESGLGIITLDRAQALNALSLDMIRAISSALLQWERDAAVDTVVFRSSSERAFCAGGDIRFFHRVATGGLVAGSAQLEDFFTEEYRLNHLIHNYPKQTVAIMDGVVMGGGMGISQGCDLRIVTERTKMGMPETSIGLFPDVGGGYFLSRACGQLGEELALTGRTINAEDALLAGLADIAVWAGAVEHILPMLAAAKPGERVAELQLKLAAHPAQPMESLYRKEADNIALHFTHSNMEAILHSLAADHSDYAREALHLLSQRSPLMLCVTLEQIRRAENQSLAEDLRMERDIVRHCFEIGEVVEGIRARVIDKDQQPRWRHARVEDVSEADVAAFFAPVWPAHAHPLRELS